MKKVKFELTKAPHIENAPAKVRQMLNKPFVLSSEDDTGEWDFSPSLSLWVDETETGAELKASETEVIARFNDIKGIKHPLLVIRSFTDKMQAVFCSDDRDNLNNIILEVIS